MEKTAIILPCYNEDVNIPLIINEIVLLKGDQQSGDVDFIFVDDGSSDNTLNMLLKFQEQYQWLVALNHKKNMGFAAALQTGRKYALDHNYDYIGQMDCDLSHPLNILPLMLNEIRSCDMVIASRYVKGGGMKNVPLRRILLSYSAQFVFRLLFGIKTRDATSGYRVMKKNVLHSIILDENNFAIQLEFTVKAEKKHFRIREIPFVLINRQYGISKFSFKDLVIYLRSIYRLRLTPLS